VSCARSCRADCLPEEPVRSAFIESFVAVRYVTKEDPPDLLGRLRLVAVAGVLPHGTMDQKAEDDVIAASQRDKGNALVGCSVVANMDPKELDVLLKVKLDEGDQLLKALASFASNVEGIAKLEKKVRQEVKFLRKFLSEERQRGRLKSEHLQVQRMMTAPLVI